MGGWLARGVWSAGAGVLASGLVVALLLVTGTPVEAGKAVAARDARSAADSSAICAGVSAIPVEECEALVALYEATDGGNWLDNAGWLDVDGGATPCDWQGVLCEEGRVVGLQLAGNRLRGRLPRSLARFDHLRDLQLARNGLTGNAPATLCALTDTVESADLGHNQLAPRAAGTRVCLDQLDPDWAATQTVPPGDFRLAALRADGFDLAWTPAPTQVAGGYYEVSVKNTFGGGYVVHGVTEDLTAGSYRVDGLDGGQSYFVRVRTVTPGLDGQPETVVSDAALSVGVTQGNERILLAVYISADNNLSPHVRAIVERIRTGTATNPNVTAIVLADRLGSDNTDVVRIEAGVITVTDAVTEEWGVAELDVADPAVLTWFLDYARAQVAADRTVVSLIGHGVGPAPEVAWLPPSAPGQPPRPPQQGIPPLPQGSEYTPADVTDGSYISTVGLGRALLAATDDGANPFDILFFDQCFQGNIDVLYEVRKAADLFIASPNYAWLIAPYAKYVAQLAPAASNSAIAQSIIERYEGSLNIYHPNAIFWLSADDIETIAAAIGQLGDALRSAIDAGESAKILAAARASLYVDTAQCGEQQFVLGPPDELLGAGSFALRLRSAFPAEDAPGVHAAADALAAAVAGVSGASITGSPYLAPEQSWEYTDRITMLAPLARNAAAPRVWRASLYREETPLTAVWGPNPAEQVVISDTFAFVRDHSWDEFIGAWYSAPLTPTVGAWCYYTPPSLVVDENAESLTLDLVVVGDGTVELTWSESADVDPVAHWLFAKSPRNVERELIAVLEPDVLTSTLTELEAGPYRFLVAAVDADNVVVAQSEVIEFTVERAQRLFLPLVAAP